MGRRGIAEPEKHLLMIPTKGVAVLPMPTFVALINSRKKAVARFWCGDKASDMIAARTAMLGKVVSMAPPNIVASPQLDLQADCLFTTNEILFHLR